MINEYDIIFQINKYLIKIYWADFLSESGPSDTKMKSDTDYEMEDADKEEGYIEEEKEDVEVHEEDSIKGKQLV